MKNISDSGYTAHSFDGNKRYWNISDVKVYIDKMTTNEIWFESEVLSKNNKMNEKIMTSLRTMWGLGTRIVKKHWGGK